MSEDLEKKEQKATLIKHKKTETDSEFINTIIKWLYHFTNEIETPAQMNDSYAKLEDFIVDAEDDTELTAALVNYTSIWLRESFKPLLRLLCQCYYQNVPCGDVNANCFVESDNAALKKDPMRPNANSKLYVSAKASATCMSIASSMSTVGGR